jgi:hypothetical protein
MVSPHRRQTVLVGDNRSGTGALIEMSVAKDKRAEDDAGTKRDHPYEIVHADHSTSHATLLFLQVVPANHTGENSKLTAHRWCPSPCSTPPASTNHLELNYNSQNCAMHKSYGLWLCIA